MSTPFTTTAASSPASTAHRYTLSSLTSAITHALGGTPSSGTTAADICNDALQYLTDYHPWTWLRKPLSLNLVNAQNYLSLPTDFKAIHAELRNSNSYRLRMVTLEDIYQLRASALSASFDLYAALSFTTQASLTVLPLYRMELYPTPTANSTAAITGTYLRIVPKLTNSTDVPDVPAPWHPALMNLCRAMAVNRQFREDASEWQEAEAKLMKLIDFDGIGQTPLGRMVGAVDRIRVCDDGPRNLIGSITTP